MPLRLSRNPFIGGLQAADDERGTDLTGLSEAAGSVPILWIGTGGGVTCVPPLDIVWCWLGISAVYHPSVG